MASFRLRDLPSVHVYSEALPALPPRIIPCKPTNSSAASAESEYSEIVDHSYLELTCSGHSGSGEMGRISPPQVLANRLRVEEYLKPPNLYERVE